ncbi:hypothetical protein [Xanthomonas phage JGB6]|nr:hypothetical protein [Xanthomonas phage JGB6]
MHKFLLIDGNNFMYAAQYGSRRLTAGDTEVTAVYGFLGSLRNVCLRFPGAIPIVLWDSTPNWRVDVYPEYKGNRKENKQLALIAAALRPQRPIVKELLRDMGVRQYAVDKYEADDLAADLTRKLNEKGSQVVLVTRDGDWQQLVNEKTVWYDHKMDFVLNLSNFQEITGFKTPQHFVQGKIISGDGGDNVKGLGGLGDGAAVTIMGEFDSFNEMRANWPAFEAAIAKGSKWSRYYRAPISKALADPDLDAKYQMNELLMDLVNHQYPEIQYQTDARYNEDAVKKTFGRLGFHSLLRKYEPWIEANLKIRKTKWTCKTFSMTW